MVLALLEPKKEEPEKEDKCEDQKDDKGEDQEDLERCAREDLARGQLVEGGGDEE